jgi:hypothetical protein
VPSGHGLNDAEFPVAVAFGILRLSLVGPFILRLL